MDKLLKTSKPKAGLLLIASPRFKNLSGPKRGTYGERKDKAVKEIKATMDFLDLVDPGIVYEREDAERAMNLFYNEKVDFVYAEFLSWSEDFAWIRFLRDCPDIPIIFCNVAKPRMSFETKRCPNGKEECEDRSRHPQGDNGEAPGVRYRRKNKKCPPPFQRGPDGQYERGHVEHIYRQL